MRRSVLVLWLVSGLALVVTLGAVVALASDSVVSQGNNVESNVLQEPQLDIQVAFGKAIEGVESCDQVGPGQYSDGPITALFDGVVVDSASTDSFLAPVCIKNAGDIEGLVMVSFDNIVDTEVGACEANEEAQEGSATCADGDPGELSPFILIDWHGDPPCVSYVSGVRLDSGDVLDLSSRGRFTLQPGQTCLGSFHGVAPHTTSDDPERFALQTDRTQFDIIITLEPVVP